LVHEAARLGSTHPSFELAAETMGRLLRIWISDSTVWRQHKEVTSQLEMQVEKEEQEIPYYVAWQDIAAMGWIPAEDPIEAHASVSIDGVKILTREDGYREVKMVSVSEVVVESASEECSLDLKRAAPGEDEPVDSAGDVRGRQDGLTLTAHSYRAVLGDKATFVPALRGELARRRVRTAGKISTPNDGADWIWDLTEKYLPSRRVEILDWPHAVENLAKASKAGWGEGTPEAQAWLEQRKTELWNGHLVQVKIGLEKLPQRYKERGKAIRQVKNYLDQHRKRLAYDRFRAEGLPIGSGTVESAARNLVTWRMKRGGQRWSEAGATRMLVAVGEVNSNRWDTQMQRLVKAG
jgi:hypothetical protein